ncbi:MAG: hypothetical protein LUD01_06405 [Clostridiales bacterium]|nr:hypothetical protein [Clostridiales bacterium]
MRQQSYPLEKRNPCRDAKRLTPFSIILEEKLFIEKLRYSHLAAPQESEGTIFAADYAASICYSIVIELFSSTAGCCTFFGTVNESYTSPGIGLSGVMPDCQTLYYVNHAVAIVIVGFTPKL